MLELLSKDLWHLHLSWYEVTLMFSALSFKIYSKHQMYQPQLLHLRLIKNIKKLVYWWLIRTSQKICFEIAIDYTMTKHTKNQLVVEKTSSYISILPISKLLIEHHPLVQLLRVGCFCHPTYNYTNLMAKTLVWIVKCQTCWSICLSIIHASHAAAHWHVFIVLGEFDNNSFSSCHQGRYTAYINMQINRLALNIQFQNKKRLRLAISLTLLHQPVPF